jgi:osmotically inducible lipoprotein OsmB
MNRFFTQLGGDVMSKWLVTSVVGVSLLTLTACGTVTGAAVGAAGGAAVGYGTGYGIGKGALIGTGVGAAAGAIYDIYKSQ